MNRFTALSYRGMKREREKNNFFDDEKKKKKKGFFPSFAFVCVWVVCGARACVRVCVVRTQAHVFCVSLAYFRNTAAAVDAANELDVASGALVAAVVATLDSHVASLELFFCSFGAMQAQNQR
jgi:hypothetical protein